LQTHEIFSCPFCNCSKTNSQELNNNFQIVHTKDNPKTKCYFCKASFRGKHIASHLARHTQEKAYECRYCNLSCVHQTTLKTHIAAKHRGTEEGRELWKILRKKCYFCNKYFVSYGCLHKHMVVHTMETRRSKFPK